MLRFLAAPRLAGGRLVEPQDRQGTPRPFVEQAIGPRLEVDESRRSDEQQEGSNDQQAGRNAHRVEILDKVRKWTMSQPSVKACCEALDAAAVPAAKVQTIDEVLADPQTLERGMLVEQKHPILGDIKMTNLPFHFSGCDTSPRGPAPLLGQHNREIAADLGYDEPVIDTLHADGVLYSEPDVAEFCQSPRGNS